MIFNSEKGHSITTKNIKNRREIILMDRDDCSEFETPQKSARLQEKEYKLAEKEAAKEAANEKAKEKAKERAKERAKKRAKETAKSTAKEAANEKAKERADKLQVPKTSMLIC